MTRLRKVVLIGAIAALAVLPFGSYLATVPKAGAESSQDNKGATPTKVTYLPIPAGDYRLDPSHTVIGFSIRHNELTMVSGRFKDFVGTIHYDADVTKSSVDFTAKVTSIDTGVEGRDKHLRSADFFEVEKFPEMTFKTTRVERKGKDAYVLHGDLTIKGVTKPVALPFTITGAIKGGRGSLRIGIAAQTKIDRRDFGITWGQPLEGGGFGVGHEVTIDLHLEAVQAAATAPKPAS
jgi:polyisoprenoid-binding protein YceI